VRGFTGRVEELDRLTVLVDEAPNAVMILAIEGTAGIGKTALAVQWAHRVADRYPDGQLFVNLRGYDPDRPANTPAETLRLFLGALGTPAERIPADLESRIGLYRSLVSGKRIMLVLDNARDADQVLPLLPGSPGSLVVLTSRRSLTGLIMTTGASVLALELFSMAEARLLLASRLGVDRVAADPAAVDQIIASCARLPLALAMVAARAASRPRFAMAAIAQELVQAESSLDVLEVGDPRVDVRAVFSWSYRALGTDPARLFRLFGIHPGNEVGVESTASLAGTPVDEVGPLLTELARAHLVTEASPGRYTSHDLLRSYAKGLTLAEDGEEQRRAATLRVLDHYLHTLHAAVILLFPQVVPIELDPPRPGVTLPELADGDQAQSWYAAEQQALTAALAAAGTAGLDAHFWRLGTLLSLFLDRDRRWDERITVLHDALAATQRLTDRRPEALLSRQLGGAYARAGRYEDADQHLQHALTLYQTLGDHTGQAETHMTLGFALDSQHRYREALAHAEAALEHTRVTGHGVYHARVLTTIGWCHTALGEHEKALVTCQQALPLLEQLGDGFAVACTWHSIGFAHHQLGRYQQAIDAFRQALDGQFARDRYHQAHALADLGASHRALGDRDAAREVWAEAATILDELDHPDPLQVRARLRLDDA
jgi:tetratricopeptide (TPR) repeat protein